MTIITGRQFRANQGKYISMAQKGERVILSSRAGYTELKPVDKEDAEIRTHRSDLSLMAIANEARREHEEGTTLKFKSAKEAQRWMDSL